MHTRRILTAGTLAVLSLGMAACDNDGLTGLNVNPNSPEDVPATTLFTTATRNSVSRWLGSGYNLRATALVAQHFAQVQYPDEDRYARLVATYTGGNFTGPYTSELQDYRQVIRKGREAEQPAVYAPAMIMTAYGFANITDTWGDAPYSEALRGDEPDAPLTPAYDPQQEIYTGIFATLDEATTALAGAGGTTTLGAADPIYGGNPAQWQKLSNSLRARHALRVVNVDPTLADAQLRAAFAAPGGLITTNADNAEFAWPGDGVYNNPWSSNFEGRDDHRMSQTLMNVLAATSDPRIAVFAQPTEADPTRYAGMPNALSHAAAQAYLNTASRPGTAFFPAVTTYGTFNGSGASQESYIMTAAEVLFIQAEAAARGLGGLSAGQAQGFYEAAIRASMEQWGIPSAAATAYLAQPSVAYTGGTEGLVRIAVQKWIALFGDGGQAWAEWRRTCQPATIRPGPEAITEEVIRRFPYATGEYQTNAEQIAAAVARQGADEFVTHVWWDSNPTAAPTYVAGCGEKP